MSAEPKNAFIINNISYVLERREDVGKLIPLNSIGIELGTAFGGFSERLLNNSNLSFLYTVDRYAGDRGHDLDQYLSALKRLMPYRQRCTIIKMEFSEALSLFPDDFFDFIYIDGYAHTGEENGQTLYDWYPKLKVGGMLSGDDYHPEWPLVIHEVDRFSLTHGVELNVIDCIPGEDWASQYPTWFLIKK